MQRIPPIPGETLRILRRYRRWNLKQACAGLMCLTHYCNLENGLIGNPRMDTLAKLAKRYGVSAERVFLAHLRSCAERNELIKDPSYKPKVKRRRKQSRTSTRVAAPSRRTGAGPEAVAALVTDTPEAASAPVPADMTNSVPMTPEAAKPIAPAPAPIPAPDVAGPSSAEVGPLDAGGHMP